MSLDTAFDALADPTRRTIVEELARGPRRAGELAERFPISRPGVSKHLRILRESGLVRSTKDGRARVYRLEPRILADVRGWVEQTSRMWDEALDSYKRYVEEER